MAGGSNGSRAPLVRLQLTPGLISSLPRTAGLPLFISFSTSYRELDFAVRRPTRSIGKLRGRMFRGRSSCFACSETSKIYRQSRRRVVISLGNERFVGYTEVILPPTVPPRCRSSLKTPAISATSHSDPAPKAGHGNDRVWKGWKAIKPAFHPSHTLWKSLQDSHITTASTAG